MLDKMTRVENIVAELTLILGINETMIPIIKDAAALAMSDLATSIVTEFTSLAGIMARHYALRDGIPEEVAGSSLNVVNWYQLVLAFFPFWLSKFSCQRLQKHYLR